MAEVSVIVPFNEDGAERSANWSWVERRLRHFHPHFEVIVSSDEGERWSKGRAVAAGVERASGTVLVVMDADVFVDPFTLETALTVVRSGAHPWVVPHSHVLRLSAPSTLNVRSSDPTGRWPGPRRPHVSLARHAYMGVAGGGITVLSAETYRRCPIDPRFEGWFGEDKAWRYALDTLAGKHVRLGADLWHLWHPPQCDQGSASPEADALIRRYRLAYGDVDAMTALVGEVTVDGSDQASPEDPVHASAQD